MPLTTARALAIDEDREIDIKTDGASHKGSSVGHACSLEFDRPSKC